MAELEIIVTPPFRDVHGRFTKANKNLIENQRNIVRLLGMRWKMWMQEEAPKKSGDFARGHRYSTHVQGNNITLTGTVPQPLGKWIIKGTAAHDIVAHAGGALHFFWPKGFRGAGWYSFRSVHHPGTKPNPYNERVMSKWRPEAKNQLRHVAVKWVSDVKGGA
jgi:hypothetical protein